MTEQPDLRQIGLDDGEKEQIVASVMRRVREAPAGRNSILADVLDWARPALTLAAAASIAGIVALASGRVDQEVEGTPGSVETGFAAWVQSGQRPSTLEVMAQLTEVERGTID